MAFYRYGNRCKMMNVCECGKRVLCECEERPHCPLDPLSNLRCSNARCHDLLRLWGKIVAVAITSARTRGPRPLAVVPRVSLL